MTTTTGIGVHDQNLERQIEKHMGGCMAGFFNLFERSPISGKRLYPKRLPPPSLNMVDSCSESESSVASPAVSREFVKPQLQLTTQPVADSIKSSPWKFSQAPRLSLDSRAVVDAKGGLRPREIRINTGSNTSGDDERRSPSVVARLMGLDRLPSSSSTEPEKKVELRRSASESRSRDFRFFDPLPNILLSTKTEISGGNKIIDQKIGVNVVKHQSNVRNINHQRRTMVERKSYYDTADFFPPEKCQQHQAVTMYGEIERRLKMRGIDEPSKDLETLKHILEALQLKGLLHSSQNTARSSGVKPRHNVVVDRRFSFQEGESPIVVMKPGRVSPPVNRRRVNNSSDGESPRRERFARSAVRSPGRSENRSSSPVVRRKEGPPLRVETQRRTNETTTTTRGVQSPAQSPRMTRRSDQTVNRSPRNRRSTVEICQGVNGGPGDEASTVSESSFSTCSHTDNERWRVEEYREGRNLLERCDKLLNSIAEMTINSNSNSSSAELQQPSPVSVLDPSFYKEDESSPSPVKKRTIDFKDQAVIDLEDELWSSSSSSQVFSKLDHDIDSSDDSDFSYVSEVIRASNYLPEETDLFILLEKQNSHKNNKSKASTLERKLIFDTITEILDRNRQLPPWKVVASISINQIWSEFLKIRELGPSGDLLEVICGVLKKDLAGDGWGDSHVEKSDAVLDIERMIFKDLIGETIRNLVGFAGKSDGIQAPRRKLVF